MSQNPIRTDTAKPFEAYLAGRLQRYHSHPRLARRGQTNADHAWGVVHLVLYFEPQARASTLRYAIFHDLGEQADIPAPVKNCFEELEDILEKIERDRTRELLGYDPTDYIDAGDRLLVDACDKLERILYAHSQFPEACDHDDFRKLVKESEKSFLALGHKGALYDLLANMGEWTGNIFEGGK